MLLRGGNHPEVEVTDLDTNTPRTFVVMYRCKGYYAGYFKDFKSTTTFGGHPESTHLIKVDQLKGVGIEDGDGYCTVPQLREARVKSQVSDYVQGKRNAAASAASSIATQVEALLGGLRAPTTYFIEVAKLDDGTVYVVSKVKDDDAKPLAETSLEELQSNTPTFNIEFVTRLAKVFDGGAQTSLDSAERQWSIQNALRDFFKSLDPESIPEPKGILKRRSIYLYSYMSGSTGGKTKPKKKASTTKKTTYRATSERKQIGRASRVVYVNSRGTKFVKVKGSMVKC